MYKPLVLAALGLSLAGGLATAQAAPIVGSTVNFTYYAPDLSSPVSGFGNGNYVVGAGAEISVPTLFTVDISSSQVVVDFETFPQVFTDYGPGGFNGWVLSDVFGSIDDFAAVTIDAATNMAGFGASNLSFTGDAITVNWQGLSFDSDTLVVLNFTTRDTGGGTVPLPGTLALTALGLLGLGVTARTRAGRKA